MLRARILSALVSIPLVLLITAAGGIHYFLLVFFVSLLGLRELYNLTSLEDRFWRIFGYISQAISLSLIWRFGLPAVAGSLILFFIMANIFWVVKYPSSFKDLTLVAWGMFYPGVLAGVLLLLRNLPQGFYAVLALFLAVWATDSGAFFIGMKWGKRKLAPGVSPNKSVTGAVGGVAIAALVLGFYATYLQTEFWVGALAGVLLSVTGQLGDLAESALKRWCNKKDSGFFLPGHGGVLDRLDSLLFAAPLAYILFLCLIKYGGN